MSSDFECVTLGDLRPGDYVVRGGRLIKHDGVPPGLPTDTWIDRVREGIDPSTVQLPDVDGRPTRHVGVYEVARALGVDQRTVSKWIDRYPPRMGVRPTPTPDVTVGSIMGWHPERIDEWRAWRASMPGQGAGGGRPRKPPRQSSTSPASRTS